MIKYLQDSAYPTQVLCNCPDFCIPEKSTRYRFPRAAAIGKTEDEQANKRIKALNIQKIDLLLFATISFYS